MTTIDLSDSKEWYRTPEQAEAYLNLSSKSYAKGMLQAEDILLKKNLEKICDMSPEEICYIDLGPGNGKKTLLLCNALHKAKKIEAYVAVDIQPKFLKIADKIKDKLSIESLKYETSFEKFLSYNNPYSNTPKFIYLGATFGNFNKDYIETRLSRYMESRDLVYLSAGLLPNNLSNLIKEYNSTLEMFSPVAEKYGLINGELKIRFNEDNSSIEQIYENTEDTYILGISKKYSIPSFKTQVSKYFDGEYFIEGEHIGFLGKKK